MVLSDPPLLSVLALMVHALKGLKAVCWLQDVFPEIVAWAYFQRHCDRSIATERFWRLLQQVVE